MNIEQEIRAQIEKNRGLKLAVGEINNHLSVLEGLLRNERDDAQKQVDEAYQRGLDDAWEVVKALFQTFGTESACVIVKNDNVHGAIDRLKVYEEQKADEEIKVGDEVETKDGKKFVVTAFGSSLDGDIAVGVCADGLGRGVDLKELRKTGRRFDIEKILEEMRG